MVPSELNSHPGLPLIEELAPPPDPMTVLRRLQHWPNLVLFESALKQDRRGRYSFLTADPFSFHVRQRVRLGDDPFSDIQEIWETCRHVPIPDLPPFQGGAAGLFSYELGTAWERIPRAKVDEFQLPDLAVGLYDWVLAWDHQQDRCWIIAHGFPETALHRRIDRAAARIESIQRALADTSPAPHPSVTRGANPTRRAVSELAPQWIVPELKDLTSNFSRDDYLRAVERVIEYIHAGDIYQANLSQRLLSPLRHSTLDLYERLRARNPAPFAGYFSHDDWTLLSASPERFVCLTDGEVETRPIKGTRQRGTGPEADLFTRDALRESEKDQAENVMIVDLLRNDLSRVCQPGSIRVPKLCTVETYETVQHLVSEVRGRLNPGCSAWDLFRAVFPGGSITGAPKVRAMEIIAELEPTARGPYCGSLFYVGFDGQSDSNILIRTFTSRNGWLEFPVGGGIVAQSDPAAEYRETWHKAEGLLRALDR